MTVLSREARSALDEAIQEARRKAEQGARNALLVLGVDEERKPGYLTAEQAEIRRQLRTECRRLGSFDDLVRSVAYERWHRMLFARFLAENSLLIHPEFRVPVTLDECEEIAREEGRDLWEVAGDYAAEMLPGLFRRDSPVTRVRFAAEDTMALRSILARIPSETFLAEDALGWTYQFWQTDAKREVNASERKVEGYDICAVTQLFTEPYMVQFLLQNTLGAWWLHLHPDSPLRNEWRYYREGVQHDFSAWPESPAELKILDPCCGSGHFLVAAFHMLLAMRREVGEETEAAIRGILTENLHGLELDPRCIQIATFSIALEAWKAGFPTDSYLPVPNLACTGIPIRAKKEEWLSLAGDDGLLEGVLAQYYDLFKNADTLGSLIRVDKQPTLVDPKTLEKKFEQALRREKDAADPVAETFGETGEGVLKAAGLLSRRYDYVMTNVPYLTSGKQGEVLRGFIEENHPLAKNDLATVFLERCLAFCRPGGKVSIVLPQNWLFLASYKRFREHLLKKERWDLLVRLGPGAFETISGEVVKAILLNLTHAKPPEGHLLCGLDVSEERDAGAKARALLDAEISCVEQAGQLGNPDARIILDDIHSSGLPLLTEFVDTSQGLKTGDDNRYRREFWEIAYSIRSWRYYQSTTEESQNLYDGMHYCVDWRDSGKNMARLQGQSAWGNKGIAVSQMRELNPTFYSGELYDSNVGPIIPHDPSHLPAIWCFCSSPDYNIAVRKIDQSLKVTNATLVKVPFDLPHWQKVAAEKYPHGLPAPYSNDPTQWIFHGHPCGSVIWDEETKMLARGPLRTDGTVLHVAIARLLGYRWPAELDPDMELADLQREWVAESKKLLSFADKDGIVTIPSIRGEGRLVDRLRSLLAAAYGPAWSPHVEDELLRQAGYTKKDGSLKGDLEGFLRDEFFASHSRLFNNRPFIWQVWDGTKDGFSVLLNYHKLDKRNLERLTYTYLGAWINQQRTEVEKGLPGAERRLAAAEDLKERLAKILEGEEPYDIFVRWKPLHEQPIGWDPDLNDGVRLNIRPFVKAGVLRSRPNINWNKDRGKDPVPNASGSVERYNDRHFKLEEKRKAREKVKER
ncbi:Eco57I restriction-modification methylase domain-containing protein [Methanoculleus receptaculi]|uniref:site-specific DNA-methyltransferase (adenine-specific) n=1 Tax=Methanoculleus receptaculi TaxID=394967 RepID=A0AAX4FS89_9EURY|nr:N-6 DNA methylase [Methanoculleus receptaculi]WOX56799.1 N-6 DNA methylase [Methanoculleus receptaculi]